CSLATAALVILGVTSPADGPDARVQSLGGLHVLTEDASNVFSNPSLVGAHSNRVFFSLGLSGNGTSLGLEPHGGGFVTFKDTFTLGVVLNRSPESYGFGRALWPVALAYLPDGPGGDLVGPDGPVETTAPLRFPADLFLGFGNVDSPFRFGVNLYYAGGSDREWAVSDANEDDLEDSTIIRKQTHLFSATLGVSGGSAADRLRPEGWVRVSHLSAWHDQLSDIETEPGVTEPISDYILSIDRDLRVGGGFRMHIGDRSEGVVFTPGVEYDAAFGTFRFDDNLRSPDGGAELASRAVMAHDARAGLGIACRKDGLMVQATASVTFRDLQVVDEVEAGEDEVDRTTSDTIDLAIPEISIGAEYRVLPVLFLRAGLRSAVVGGKQVGTARLATGDDGSPYEYEVVQTVQPTDVTVTVAGTAGFGLEVRRMKLDALFGGVFLGEGSDPAFFSRIDLGFNFK
ncbi:MAG: hypothetical protein VX498_11390, partial [Myxococcota bacterium]|nr:hypothetical protein [Myxococcota bacterium]